MNIFLGVPIPEQDIETLVNLLLQAYPHWENHKNIRWTFAPNHHLTLHFFGKVPPASLNDCLFQIGQELSITAKFSLNIHKINNFPKTNSDLVAAYVELNSALAHLYQRVEQLVQNHGFPTEDRPYLPHITLCRSKYRHVLTMSPILMKDFKIDIDQVVLYQSQEIKGVHGYLPLYQWSLIPPSHGREL